MEEDNKHIASPRLYGWLSWVVLKSPDTVSLMPGKERNKHIIPQSNGDLVMSFIGVSNHSKNKSKLESF